MINDTKKKLLKIKYKWILLYFYIVSILAYIHTISEMSNENQSFLRFDLLDVDNKEQQPNVLCKFISIKPKHVMASGDNIACLQHKNSYVINFQ